MTTYAILSAVPMPIVVTDARERVLALNPLATGLLGKDQVGRHVVTVIRQPPLLQAISDCAAQGRVSEARYIRRDHAHETIYRAICTPTGEGGVLVSFQDVTSLETAGQMRRDFVANVSHELRTPLTAIQGFIETLQGPARGDQAAADRFLATMSKEAGRMIRLVGDLLSLSQVEGEERIRPTERVELHAILKSVIRTLGPAAEAAGVELLIETAAEERWLLGDPDQLMQVFVNLTENAIKYGHDGGRVILSLSEVARDPILGLPALQVDIRDFGQGFDEMHSHRLTERFYRVDSHRSRAVGGTGLGLAIVKHIVNRHKGRLKIHSEIGKGSCFSVLLPTG
ncbi:ATP-binding protein [Mangrovicoccus algicola]|uniref:histidine kinase n=1 Tax=Mangrovicoccus algicola TaxID=2771008 RepID=A0A8J6YVN5_9RHOB|nr:ATP-binding protein [Mangrovicoccus algicola]MBE3638612.1 two-component sensor histidine kinase [Mangrovicoccus algicola]